MPHVFVRLWNLWLSLDGAGHPFHSLSRDVGKWHFWQILSRISDHLSVLTLIRMENFECRLFQTLILEQEWRLNEGVWYLNGYSTFLMIVSLSLIELFVAVLFSTNCWVSLQRLVPPYWQHHQEPIRKLLGPLPLWIQQIGRPVLLSLSLSFKL